MGCRRIGADLMRGSMRSLMRGAAVSSALDTQTVTSATTGISGEKIRGYTSAGGGQGSISPGTTTIGGGSTITAMYFDQNYSTFTLSITGASDSGWTTMTNTTEGKSLSRAAASFTGGTWTWTGQTLAGFFGAEGAKTVVFT